MEHSQAPNCLPAWEIAELPEPKPLKWEHWSRFIGPGIVMMGIQIGGGEWLLGPDITAKYGGGLMWIATIAIICQVFYNLECGRYALYCGEPIFTGFMRTKPGPRFWMGVILFLNFSALIPALSTNGAAMATSLYLDRPPGVAYVKVRIQEESGQLADMKFAISVKPEKQATPQGKLVLDVKKALEDHPKHTHSRVVFSLIDDANGRFAIDSKSGKVTVANGTLVDQEEANDRRIVTGLAYLFIFLVSLPVLIGGKVYNMLQTIMTGKVIIVLGFCLVIGLCYVSAENWLNVFSGFLKFGTVPTTINGKDATVNIFQNLWLGDGWPLIVLTNIATLGAFAGYAGGGGLSNSTYSNFVRDKGWGMGSVVGAIPSAVGGKQITLSHLGKTFTLNTDNLRKWKAWWKYIIVDQVFVWGPGCFMGMALPALLSLEFSSHSQLRGDSLDWAQSLISADGIRHDPRFSEAMANMLWIVTILVGMLVMLPSQMSIVDDFSRRWTDILWSGSRRMRSNPDGHAVKRVYYSILAFFVAWTLAFTYVFSTWGTPKLMTLVIANLNNLAIGVTSFHLLWINCTLLPRELRPRWYHRVGVVACGVFYLGMSGLVFMTKQWPILREFFGI